MSFERAEVPAMPWPTGPVPRPESLTAAPNPIGLLAAFRRRWILASFLGVLLGSVLALIPYFVMPVRFNVGTWLTVAEEDPYIVFNKRSNPDAFERYKSADAQMLTTPGVLNTALRKSEVHSLPMLPKVDTVEFLQKNISVNYPGDSTLMRIAMKGEDPAQLKVLVNAVREAYLTEVVEKRTRGRLDKLAQMRKLLTLKNRDIKNARGKRRGLLKTLGSTPDALTQKVKLYNAELTSLHRDMMNAHSMIRRLRGEVALAQAGVTQAEQQDPAVAERFVEQTLLQDPEYASIREQWLLLVKTLRIERDKARDRDKSPNRRLEEDLLDLEEEISVRKASLREELAVQIKEETVTLAQAALSEAQTRLGLAEGDEKIIIDELAVMEPQSVSANTANDQILAMDEDLHELGAVAERLRRTVEELDLEIGSPPRVARLYPAETEGNDRMMKYSIVGFSGLLGLLGAVFGISFIEFQKRRIGSTNDVSEGLGVKVIGALPALSGNTWSKMIGRNRPGAARGLLSESVDSLRSALLHGEGKDDRKVIMITSATAGEGKTTVATQLAASLARAGRRTLLIDADLRSPKAHRVFELPLDPGLSEVLRNEAEVDDVIRPTRAPGLWMIAAGGCCHECIQALARDDIRVMFEKLRSEFDFVIVDSGPVLSGADSLSLGVCVDAAVLSVLKDASQATKVYEAFERLDTIGVHVLGAVVNGVTPVVSRNIAALPVRASA